MPEQPENQTRKLTPAEILERHRYKGKLTPMFREKALDMVRKGAPPRTALRALGVSDPTIYQWERWAQSGDNGDKYPEFFTALKAAEQEWLASLSERASRIADGRVAVDMLGRRDPEHWAKRDEMQVTYEMGPMLADLARQLSAIPVTYQLEEGEDAIQGCEQEEGSPTPEHGAGEGFTKL